MRYNIMALPNGRAFVFRAFQRVGAVAQLGERMTGSHEVVGQAAINLSQLIAAYRVNHQDQQDGRRTEMWLRVLGPTRDPSSITFIEWENFIAARRSGGIGCRGETGNGRRRKVGARAVEADLKWLRAVLGWGARAGLLPANPVGHYPIPKPKGPHQPLATEDWLSRILAVAPQVHPYLSPLVHVAHGTGRRISSILHLRWNEYLPSEGLYGAIKWPASHDKLHREWLVPINLETYDGLAVLGPTRQAIPVFRSEFDPQVPVNRHMAARWLKKACRLAGVENRGWHSLRRKWATDRKHFPDVDVMAAGGWTDIRCLKTCYQQVDLLTLEAVVQGR